LGQPERYIIAKTTWVIGVINPSDFRFNKIFSFNLIILTIKITPNLK